MQLQARCTLVTPCLFSCLSLHFTCIYHSTYVSYHLTSTHHSPSHISYFQYLSVCFIFISLADDGCNTAIESFQTDRLLRVFHSCYFHYSEDASNHTKTRRQWLIFPCWWECHGSWQRSWEGGAPTKQEFTEGPLCWIFMPGFKVVMAACSRRFSWPLNSEVVRMLVAFQLMA